MTSKRKVKIETLRESVNCFPDLSMREQIKFVNSCVTYLEQLNRRVENIELFVKSQIETKKRKEL